MSLKHGGECLRIFLFLILDASEEIGSEEGFTSVGARREPISRDLHHRIARRKALVHLVERLSEKYLVEHTVRLPVKRGRVDGEEIVNTRIGMGIHVEPDFFKLTRGLRPSARHKKQQRGKNHGYKSYYR
ncbi:MAG: hypothetical protein HDS44_06045 [Bacteroides sp.]|nr:hypothetical protein [Bacteroides sp.]